MARRATFFGIGAIVTAFMTMPFFSVPLACFAILFAYLAKGKEHSLDRDGKIAMTTALVGIIVSVVITAKVYTALSTDEEYRNNVAQLADTLYGDEYTELYGESFSDMMNRLFSGRTE